MSLSRPKVNRSSSIWTRDRPGATRVQTKAIIAARDEAGQSRQTNTADAILHRPCSFRWGESSLVAVFITQLWVWRRMTTSPDVRLLEASLLGQRFSPRRRTGTERSPPWGERAVLRRPRSRPTVGTAPGSS